MSVAVRRNTTKNRISAINITNSISINIGYTGHGYPHIILHRSGQRRWRSAYLTLELSTSHIYIYSMFGMKVNLQTITDRTHTPTLKHTHIHIP